MAIGREDGFRLAYSTALGRAYQGDSRELLASDEVPPGSVDLLMTSPPFALTGKKDYGNEDAERYVAWFLTFVEPFSRALKDTGSIVIDIGGAYLPGRPQRSTYHFELAVALEGRLELCQEFYWFNPAKLPSPAEWVNVRRQRAKDSVNLILWFARDATRAKADNRRVLKRYSDSMEALLKSGYQYGVRPSGHDITHKFSKRHAGAIPSNLLGSTDSPEAQGLAGRPFEENFPNLLAISNTSSNDRYQKTCKAHGIKPHPARFPVGLPAFFIEFLTEPGDTVLDPFAGSNVTGEAAEVLRRRWIACDLDREGKRAATYVRASAFRFRNAELAPEFGNEISGDYVRESRTATGEAASTSSPSVPVAVLPRRDGL
jgi:site-specific DNA-methyltransferase (cytosine-N4-specific)